MNRSPALPSSSSVNGRQVDCNDPVVVDARRLQPSGAGAQSGKFRPAQRLLAARFQKKLNDQQLKELVAKMDVQEKVGQLVNRFFRNDRSRYQNRSLAQNQ